MVKLDATDKRLLNILQEDSNRSLKELSSILNLSIGPVNERIKKLRKTGVISKNVALLDYDAIGKKIITYCAVRVEKHKFKELNRFEDEIQKMDEVQECYTIAGEHDYLLKVITSSMEEYQEFVINKLSKLDMIFNVSSQFVMKKVKYGTKVKLD